MQVKKLSESDFAAEISGIDLTRGVAPDVREEIVALHSRYPVLCFRNQPLDDDGQQAFISAFGEAARPSLKEISTGESRKHANLFDVATVDENGNPVARGSAYEMYMRANLLWHSDGSQRELPIRVTALSARVLPPKPPATEFADMRAAYDALSDARKQFLKGRIADHSIFASRAKIGMKREDFSEESRAARPTVSHAMVRVHPISGRKALYVGSHSFRIQGLPESEGAAIIEELVAFATQPKFVYAHQWQPNDLVMWDNSMTVHRATPYEGKEPRVMRWSGVREPAPV